MAALRHYGPRTVSRPANAYNNQIRPPGRHFNGTTYTTFRIDRGDTDKVVVMSFDHDLGTWSDPVEIAQTQTDDDSHFSPCITVDSNGIIYVGFDFRRDNQRVFKSDNAEDISSWTEQTAPATGSQGLNYCLAYTIGTDIYLFSRRGSSSSGHLIVNKSTDGASSWTETELTDDSGGKYPANFRFDGTDFHLLVGRRGPSDFSYFFYVKYDVSSDSLVGPNGVDMGTGVTKTTLSNNNCIIADTDNPEYGSGIALDGTKPHVAYLQNDGANWNIHHATYDSENDQWVDNQVDGNIAPTPNQFDGGLMNLVLEDPSNLTLYEGIWMRQDTDDFVGKYETTTGGRTWSDRSQVTELGAGSDFQEIRDASGMKWLAIEFDTDQRVLAYDDNFDQHNSWNPRGGHHGTSLRDIMTRHRSSTSWDLIEPARIESFEDGITEYGGDQSVFAAEDWPLRARHGFFILVSSDTGMISSTTGLNRYPSQGDHFKVDIHQPNNGNGFNRVWWATDDESNDPNGYRVVYDTGNSPELKFQKDVNDVSDEMAVVGLTKTVNEWLTLDVDWQSDGTHVIDLLNLDGNSILNSPISHQDTDHKSGGIGFENVYGSNPKEFYWDDWRIV